MKCRRAKLISPNVPDQFFGRELWVEDGPPLEGSALVLENMRIVDSGLFYITPYRGSIKFISIWHNHCELLSRGPEDWAEIDPWFWDLWEQGQDAPVKENTQ